MDKAMALNVSFSFPSPERPTADHPQVVLVFFLGGCSYAEISALRFLSQREIGMLPWRYMYLYTFHCPSPEFIIAIPNFLHQIP